jgi:hypothetical protein
MRASIGAVLAILMIAAGIAGSAEVDWVPAHDLLPADFLGGPATAGDLDADEDTDLSVIGEGASEHYCNAGTQGGVGWVADATVYETVGSCGLRAGALGDLDADGDLDLVLTCFEGTVRLHENVGSPAEPAWERVPDAFPGITVAQGGTEPSLADIDGDGDLDLIVTAGPRLILNVGTPAVPAWVDAGRIPGLESGPWAMASAAVGDIDGDGDLDIVQAAWEYRPQAWENVGTPTAYEFVENPALLAGVDVPAPCFGIELLDVDGDTDLDLVVSGPPGASSLYLNEQITSVGPSSWGAIKALYR